VAFCDPARRDGSTSARIRRAGEVFHAREPCADLAAIDDANGSHSLALEKLKKSKLAVSAEQLLAGNSWLPQPLRNAVNDNDCMDVTQAAE